MKRLFGSFLLLSAITLAAATPKLELQAVITEGIRQPVDVQVAPEDSDRLYVVEQRGVISVVERGKLVRPAFLDIVEKVVSGGEMGLLGLAFHPQFAQNKRYFINYNTRRPKLTTVIAELRAGSREEKELLSFEQPYTNHKGGQLAFDKAGMLYIAVGDGGSAGDPHGNGQNKNVLLGKILRIDVDKPADGLPYGIPADNPFAGGGGRKEVFAYGLRNPWRFSFDRVTGFLFAADVGQDKWEEIDIVENGKNYGWNVMEGKHCYKPEKNCKTKDLTPPIFEYPRKEGDCIIGGYVYRGSAIPELRGVYLYADFDTYRIWGLHYNQDRRKFERNELLLQTDLPISSFGQDARGEIYVASLGGAIYKLAKKAPAPGR